MGATPRTVWIVTVSIVMLTLAILFRQEPAALVSMAVLVWVAWEWLNFRFRLLVAGRSMVRASRKVDGDTRTPLTLITGCQVPVEVNLQISSRLAGLRCCFEDLPPAGCEVVGSNRTITDGPYGESTHWRYELHPRVIRRTSLPGLRWVVSDPQGLFRQEGFLPLAQNLTILPFLVRPQATTSILKRQNVQLMAGTHRFRSEGTSTELHGIRDYRPGDPPRSIAWKTTARLGRLMTCEYESEVPARATILADLTPVQFLGRPGPAPADRIIEATASIARLLMSDRDPVACLLLSQDEQSWLQHGLGERHLTRLLWRLLACAPALNMDELDLDTLGHLAWTIGGRRYPELFDEVVNRSRAYWLTFSRRRQRARREREELSHALAVVYRGAADFPIRLQIDDRLFRDYCGQLLTDCDTTLDLPPPAESTSLAAQRKTCQAICRGLLTGVARARDNELFAIIGAIPREPAMRNDLEDAIRVACGAYHRVILIDVAASLPAGRFVDAEAERILVESRQSHRRMEFEDFARRLRPFGAKLVSLEDGSWMEAVVAELGLIKSGRARVVGSRQ